MADEEHPAPDDVRAYHEAGHAIACYLMGLGPELATIEPTEDSQGHCAVAGRDLWKANPDMRKTWWGTRRAAGMVVVYLAGSAAESTYTGRAAGDALDSDMLEVEGHITLLTGESIGERRFEEYLTQAQRETRELIEHCLVWAAVRAVAEALMRERTLSIMRVREMIRTAMGTAQ